MTVLYTGLGLALGSLLRMSRFLRIEVLLVRCVRCYFFPIHPPVGKPAHNTFPPLFEEKGTGDEFIFSP